MHRVMGAGLLFAMGCATTYGGASSSAVERFPSRKELTTLSLRTPSLDVAKQEVSVVDRWELTGPLPTHAGVTPKAPTSALERALAERAPAVSSHLTQELSCYAREYGRFMLERESQPGTSLRAFLRRRCGLGFENVRVQLVGGALAETEQDAEVFAHWDDSLRSSATSLGHFDVAGAWFGRSKGKGVLVLAGATLPARLEAPVPLVGGSSSTITIKGRLTSSAERVSALVNDGEYSVQTCKTVGALKPPDFAFECPLNRSDERTVLEVVAFDPGRLLGRSVVELLLWPAGAPSAVWEQKQGADEVLATELEPKLLGAINKLRVRAKLPLLSNLADQSTVAVALAPHYFEASLGLGGGPETLDQIALGMMAGWEAQQELVSAGFGSMWTTGTRDLNVFVEQVMDSPFVRHAVTNPRARFFAAGSMRALTSSLAAIFATYVPLERFDRKDAQVAIVTRLNQLRLDRKLPLAQWTLWPEDEAAVVEQNLASRRWNPDDALQHVLRATANVSKGEVRGYVQLVDDLENFQFPTEVLLRANVNIFTAVGVYRAEGWAHARYVVCFVLAKDSDIEIAKGPPHDPEPLALQ